MKDGDLSGRRLRDETWLGMTRRLRPRIRRCTYLNPNPGEYSTGTGMGIEEDRQDSSVLRPNHT